MDSIGSVGGSARILASVAIVALSAACAKRDATAPVLDASVAISFSGRSVLVVQQTLQLTATVHDTSGATLTRQTVQWTSADTTVATVSSSGLVTAGVPGTVVITATSDGGVAATTLTVVPHVSQVSVFLEPVGYLAVGGSMYVGVTALAANGDVVAGLPESWSSSDTAMATVSPVGVVTAAATPGTVSVTATVDGVSGSASVTIVPLSAVASLVVKPATISYVGGTLGFGAATQLSVTAADTSGVAVLGVSATWALSDPSAAAVSATGLVTPNPLVLAGTSVRAQITGTVGAVVDTVPILVCPAVASITTSTSALSLTVGQTVTVAATVLDARGNIDLAPLDAEVQHAVGVVPISVKRIGFDSLAVTGAAAGIATVDFFDPTSSIRSDKIQITVSAAAAMSRRVMKGSP